MRLPGALCCCQPTLPASCAAWGCRAFVTRRLNMGPDPPWRCRIRDSAVQMGLYLPYVGRRPALRRLVEGTLRSQALFTTQVRVQEEGRPWGALPMPRAHKGSRLCFPCLSLLPPPRALAASGE